MAVARRRHADAPVANPPGLRHGPMVQVRPVLQPFRDQTSMFEMLSALLTDDRYANCVAVVAWARLTGLSRLSAYIQAFRARGGYTEIILGVDEGGASVEGLTEATVIFDAATVLYDSSSGTFHPKLWMFSGEAHAAAIVGSNNLTAGGLYLNYEAALMVEFDMGQSADVAVHDELAAYIERLRSDDTSRPLTLDLIDELRDSVEITIKDESRRAQRAVTQQEEGDETDAGAPTTSLFGKSAHRKKPDPARGRRPRGSTQPSDDRDADGEWPTASPETSPVVESWSKLLTRSDCGRPRPGSNTTAALRFTQAGYSIDQATWFRDALFVDVEWLPDHTRDGRERATVRFDVTINGIVRGTHDLAIKYDRRREAGQSNFTTDLKWGSLNPVLREIDLVGHFVYIDQHENGVYSMRIAPPEDLTQQ